MSGMGDRGQNEGGGGQNIYSKSGSMKKGSKYGGGGGGGGGGGSINRYNRGSMDGGRQQQQMVIQIERDLELNRTENPYQIKRNVDEHELLLREVRTILNKLTPQNLQKLTGDLINLPINTKERLEDSIDIIFEKSIDEQVFSTTYAQLCKVLSTIKVPIINEPGKFVNFRTMLLTKCQREFDSDYAQNINYEKMLAEAETQTDETKKREMKELAEEKLTRAKRRSLGNIRFIGELFKLQMLTEGIMNDCIDRLLKQENDEENLECLCKLMSTIGKELDKANNATKMKTYFDKLMRISTKKDNVSARIRFMIMDVIDLRKSQWVPRRKDVNPRRIEEIRKEAEEEQLRQEAEYAKNAAAEKGQRGGMPGGMSGGKGSQGGKGGQGYQQHAGGQIGKSTSMDSEGFNPRNKAQNGSMVKSIKEVKSITNKNLNGELTLGPGGGGFSWASKSKPVASTTASTTSAASSSSQSTSSAAQSSAADTKTTGSDEFERRASSSSASSSTSGQQRSGITSRPSLHHERSDDKSGQLSASSSQQGVTARLSMDQNRYGGHKQFQNVKRIDSASSLTNTASQASSQASSRDSSQTRPGSANPASAAASSAAYVPPSAASKNEPSTTTSTTSQQRDKRSYTEDEIERKALNMIEEYATNKNIAEALGDIDEFRPVDATQHVQFMERLFLCVLDRNECTRSALGTILQQAMLAKKLHMDAFTEGLKRVVEQVEDMAIDIPKICTYLAQSIGPIFNESLSVDFLSPALEPVIDREICAELISEILHQASNRLGHSSVATIFQRSGLKLNMFLRGLKSSAAQSEFIRDKNLQWCQVGGGRERTQSASISTESYERHLKEILANREEENESIFDKIEAEFGQVDCESKPFIRALVISVCTSCIDDNKIDPDLFKKRSAILNKFINKKEEFELEALFAIQALDHRTHHQPNFIRVLFDLLYDEDIIVEEVFWQWKEDVREDGHAISELSLKAFFDWLKEADAEQ